MGTMVTVIMGVESIAVTSRRPCLPRHRPMGVGDDLGCPIRDDCSRRGVCIAGGAGAGVDSQSDPHRPPVTPAPLPAVAEEQQSPAIIAPASAMMPPASLVVQAIVGPDSALLPPISQHQQQQHQLFGDGEPHLALTFPVVLQLIRQPVLRMLPLASRRRKLLFNCHLPIRARCPPQES